MNCTLGMVYPYKCCCSHNIIEVTAYAVSVEVEVFIEVSADILGKFGVLSRCLLPEFFLILFEEAVIVCVDSSAAVYIGDRSCSVLDIGTPFFIEEVTLSSWIFSLSIISCFFLTTF